MVSKGAGLAGARVQIVQADGVPAASSEKYEVVDRRAAPPLVLIGHAASLTPY